MANVKRFLIGIRHAEVECNQSDSHNPSIYWTVYFLYIIARNSAYNLIWHSYHKNKYIHTYMYYSCS